MSVPPRIDWLMSPGLSGAERAALARADLVRRRGRRHVEDYLRECPELAEDAATLVDLAHAEATGRQLAGEVVGVEEYADRFPELSAAIRRRFGLDPAFRPDVEESAETVAPPAGAPAEAGARVAVPGYEILGELGRGGMGVVYKARQVGLERIVALKMILAGEYAGEADLQRFRGEARALAGLHHPNIVQVYAIDEHEGRPYFSLEYCAGGSLEGRLQGAPLPPAEAAALVRTLAEAMQAAHSHGVIHRDLKPANVLLADDGTPKITDFGLAKKLDVEQGQTRTGAVLGTPSYMAPEQAQGKKDVGPLADVYALGAILYECLTGRPPFKGPTALDTILQVLDQEPASPRLLAPGVPRDLETICLKCLAKVPAHRYASAANLADDLRRYVEGEPIKARPPGLLRRVDRFVRRRPGLVVASFVVLFVAGVAVELYGPGAGVLPADRTVTRAAFSWAVLPLVPILLAVQVAGRRWVAVAGAVAAAAVFAVWWLRGLPDWPVFSLAGIAALAGGLLGVAANGRWRLAGTLAAGLLAGGAALASGNVVSPTPWSLLQPLFVASFHAVALAAVVWLAAWSLRADPALVALGALLGAGVGLALAGSYLLALTNHLSLNLSRRWPPAAATLYLEILLAYAGAALTALITRVGQSGGAHTPPSANSTRSTSASTRAV